MSVVRANIQTVDDMYRLIWTAIANKRPIEAVYKGLRRLFCPHRLGRNRAGELRVLCYQYGGESDKRIGSTGISCKLAVHRAGEVQPSPATGGCMVHRAQPFAPRILRDRRRY